MKFSTLALMSLFFTSVFAQSSEPPKGLYFSMDFHTPPMSGRSNPGSEERVFLVGKINPLVARELGIVNSAFDISETYRGGNAPVAINLNDLDFNVGFKKLSSGFGGRRMGFRFEGGIKWLRADLGVPLPPTIEEFESAPISVEEFLEELDIGIEGRSNMIGVRGGAFLDLHLNDSDHFVYLGTSLGLMNMGLEYNIQTPDPLFPTFTTEDSSLTSVFQYDAGVGFQLGKHLALKVGYEFSKFKGARLITPFSLALDKIEVTPTNRHTLKISLLHWFRRR